MTQNGSFHRRYPVLILGILFLGIVGIVISLIAGRALRTSTAPDDDTASDPLATSQTNPKAEYA